MSATQKPSLTRREREVLGGVYQHGGSHDYVTLQVLESRGLVYQTKEHFVPYRTTDAGYAAYVAAGGWTS